MARKSSRRTSSSRKSRQSGQGRSVNPLYGDILGIAGSLFRNRQQAGADKINALSAAARNFAADMKDTPNIQTYADAAAEQMESLSDYVADNSLEQIVDDAMDMARRHPLATTAFAIAVGFGFTRLLSHNAADQHSNTATSNGRSARKGTVRRTTPRKRAASAKTRTNGRGASHERENAA